MAADNDHDKDSIKGKAEPFLPLTITTMSSHLVEATFTTAQLVISLTGIGLIYGIYKLSAFIHDQLTSPIHDIPGPPNPSFLYGNFQELSVSVSLIAHTVLELK